MKECIKLSIRSLLASDETLAQSEREQWFARLEGTLCGERASADKYLTNDEAAELLGMSRWSFRRLRKEVPAESLLWPIELKDGIERYSSNRLIQYQQKRERLSLERGAANVREEKEIRCDVGI